MTKKKAKVINEIKVSFPSLSENERFSRLAVSGFASQLDPQVDEISDIKTAVSEAVTNSIVHAYKNEIGKIELVARIYDDNEIYIKIKDHGCGIPDVKKAMEPLFTTSPEEERAGLGFAVMESFMDKLRVISKEGKGTSVILTKKLRTKLDK